MINKILSIFLYYMYAIDLISILYLMVTMINMGTICESENDE